MTNIDILVEPGTDREVWAEADSPEAAVFAALTILREAWDSRPTQGYDPAVQFYVGGVFIRATTLRGLTR